MKSITQLLNEDFEWAIVDDEGNILKRGFSNINRARDEIPHLRLNKNDKLDVKKVLRE